MCHSEAYCKREREEQTFSHLPQIKLNVKPFRHSTFLRSQLIGLLGVLLFFEHTKKRIHKKGIVHYNPWLMNVIFCFFFFVPRSLLISQVSTLLISPGNILRA